MRFVLGNRQMGAVVYKSDGVAKHGLFSWGKSERDGIDIIMIKLRKR